MLKKIGKSYNEAEKHPIKIFLSFGDLSDNQTQGRKFKNMLVAKGYDLKYKEVPFGHNWQNWQPLLDDSLQWFFSKE